MPTTAITAIIQIIASVLGYLAARGIDKIIGKWVAFFMIAWEKVATKGAIEEYNRTREIFIGEMAGKWKDWDEWRKSRTPPNQGG